MSYLIDTNVVSELRKRERCHEGVADWFAGVATDEVFLSVLTIGEIRRGIELIRRRDAHSAGALDDWLDILSSDHRERILSVDQSVDEEWGRLNVPDPIPAVDGLLAATTRVHDLTLATRNVVDVKRTGVRFVNPFAV